MPNQNETGKTCSEIWLLVVGDGTSWTGAGKKTIGFTSDKQKAIEWMAGEPKGSWNYRTIEKVERTEL